jgi:hypothetical protein
MNINHWITIAACILFAIFMIAFAVGTHSSRYEDEDIEPHADQYHKEDEDANS